MASIRELRTEKRILLENLLDKKTPIIAAIVFGSHYVYLKNWLLQILMWGLFILSISKNEILLFSIGWIIYDLTRMDKLTEKANEPATKRIKEIDNLLDKHRQLQDSLNHTLNFVNRIKKVS